MSKRVSIPESYARPGHLVAFSIFDPPTSQAHPLRANYCSIRPCLPPGQVPYSHRCSAELGMPRRRGGERGLFPAADDTRS